MLDAFIAAAGSCALYMTSWFVVSLILNRNDVADMAWGLGFPVVAVAAILAGPGLSPRSLLVTGMVFVWGIRLAVHIYLRNRGKPEDFRYRKWREEWGQMFLVRSFLQVFMLQGLFLFLISTPVVAIHGNVSSPLGFLDLIGVSVWLVGFGFEALGDHQLARFKKKPESAGKVMMSGLWKWTRHPNYFGEVVLWWGIYLIALSVPYGWATVVGPVTITVLILGVSGIPMLEKRYEGHPEFEEYKRRTSAFFPLPPRSQGG